MSSDRRDSDISEIGRADVAQAGSELERQPIGSYIRRQRKLRGISVEQLARSTRIPLRSLERLEAGAFDDDVDGFVRGFVRTVAEALGLDPDDTLARMLAEPSVEQAARLDLSSRLPGMLVGLVVVVGLLAAVGLARWVATREERVLTVPAQPDLVYRHDPVRALAESKAAVAADRHPAAVVSPRGPGPTQAIAAQLDVASAPPESAD